MIDSIQTLSQALLGVGVALIVGSALGVWWKSRKRTRRSFGRRLSA